MDIAFLNVNSNTPYTQSMYEQDRSNQLHHYGLLTPNTRKFVNQYFGDPTQEEYWHGKVRLAFIPEERIPHPKKPWQLASRVQSTITRSTSYADQTLGLLRGNTNLIGGANLGFTFPPSIKDTMQGYGGVPHVIVFPGFPLDIATNRSLEESLFHQRRMSPILESEGLINMHGMASVGRVGEHEIVHTNQPNNMFWENLTGGPKEGFPGIPMMESAAAIVELVRAIKMRQHINGDFHTPIDENQMWTEAMGIDTPWGRMEEGEVPRATESGVHPYAPMYWLRDLGTMTDLTDKEIENLKIYIFNMISQNDTEDERMNRAYA